MDTKKVSPFIDSRPWRILLTSVTFTAILPVDYDQHGDILHEASSHTVFLSCISHRFPIQEMYRIIIRPLPTSCRLTVRNFLLALLFKRINDSSFTRFCFQ